MSTLQQFLDELREAAHYTGFEAAQDIRDKCQRIMDEERDAHVAALKDRYRIAKENAKAHAQEVIDTEKALRELGAKPGTPLGAKRPRKKKKADPDPIIEVDVNAA